MPRVSSSHVSLPPIDWLQEVAAGNLDITGVNVWKALRHPSFVQVIGQNGNALNEVSRLSEIARFRVTQRGMDLLENHEATCLPFHKNDPPPDIRFWLSSFRRLLRNCPESLRLTYADGELKVLAVDSKGVSKNDDLHLVESAKVRWHSS